MADVMMLEVVIAELMTTDVISTVLVSPWDGVMTTRFLGALLDDALEVVVNDGLEEGGLVVGAIVFGVTLASLVVGAVRVVSRLDSLVDVGTGF